MGSRQVFHSMRDPACPGCAMTTSKKSWSHMFPLNSRRLMLRRFNIGDTEQFAAYRSDPDVARFQSWESFSLAEATEFIARQEVQHIPKPGQWLQIAITVRPSGALIGDCAFKILASDAR